jgi:hypothetical protein
MRVGPVIPAVVACEAGLKNTALETRQRRRRRSRDETAPALEEGGEDEFGKHGVV